MLLLIDNYDSFTWNLQQAFAAVGEEVLVVRNDQTSLAEIDALEPDAVVLSPGPGTPADAGLCGALVHELDPLIPILGVCLGHQVLCVEAGAKLVRAQVPVHGKSSWVRHDGTGLFRGVASPLRVGRYHSLVIDPAGIPSDYEVVATTESGEVMAVRHRSLPRWGVQFHPESILTPEGDALLHNFLDLVQT